MHTLRYLQDDVRTNAAPCPAHSRITNLPHGLVVEYTGPSPYIAGGSSCPTVPTPYSNYPPSEASFLICRGYYTERAFRKYADRPSIASFSQYVRESYSADKRGGCRCVAAHCKLGESKSCRLAIDYRNTILSMTFFTTDPSIFFVTLLEA